MKKLIAACEYVVDNVWCPAPTCEGNCALDQTLDKLRNALREFTTRKDDDSVAAHRDQRQELISEWARRTFGEENWTPRVRALRFIEECFELCQALGVEPEALTKVMQHVYNKPVGTPEQEMGGVGVSLLALAGATGLHAEYQEAKEARRVLEKPAEHFKARDQIKRTAGLV